MLALYKEKRGECFKQTPRVLVTSVRTEDRWALLTQTQSLDDGTVASDIALLQVVEEGTTLTYETSQSTLGAVVLTVLLHVLGEVLDAE